MVVVSIRVRSVGSQVREGVGSGDGAVPKGTPPRDRTHRTLDPDPGPGPSLPRPAPRPAPLRLGVAPPTRLLGDPVLSPEDPDHPHLTIQKARLSSWPPLVLRPYDVPPLLSSEKPSDET